MAKKDPYKTLGVKKTASKEEIKKIFRTRAKKAHPDAGGDPNIFAELSNAYSLLMDDTRRANYDTTGETEVKSKDVIRNNAFAIVGNLFLSFVSQTKQNWKTKQVRAELTNQLSLSKTGVKKKLNDCEEEFKFWESVKEDVVFNGNEMDPINTALDEKLRILSIQKLSFEIEIKTLTLAIEMVRDYDFKKAPIPKFLTRNYAYVETASAF